MNDETILLRFDGHIAFLTLNRPSKLNALTPDMLDGIHRALDRVEGNRDCRALVVDAVGERAFCVGADVKLWSALEPVEMWRSWTRRGQRVFERLAGLRQPSIAAMDGLALGGGLELAMACDLRIASAGAGFGMPEVTIATLPGWGGSHRLAGLVGIGRARQMILTGERIDAETASAWGLVNEIAANAGGRAREIAARIAENAPVSVQVAKEILAAIPDGGRASERLERLAGAVAAATADGREGVAALAERRPPQFDGGNFQTRRGVTPPTILLPTQDGRVEAFRMSAPVGLPNGDRAPFNRIVYSAAHVVADPLSDADPSQGCAIDWDATLRHRERLWDLGFGIAEAMDTAQRGMGLDWPTSRELIRRSIAAGRARAAPIACGAGTDHLAATSDTTIPQVIGAYEEQVGDVEGLGGRVILMASRALAFVARDPDDYAQVYGRILSQTREKVILHWLGEMFDPALAGYWGHGNIDDAMESCLGIIGEHAAKIEGIKVSLLDKEREIAMRRRLPDGVRMYTGDDFNFPELIAGDGEEHSQALLGIFDGIAPVASQALSRLAAGDREEYFRLMNPTIPLSRHIFGSPTRFYKTGLVFLAWLNGWQDHFAMIGGQESSRSLMHLADLFRLADTAGALVDPDLARHRMRLYLETRGVNC